jgi:lipoprotein-anchoring transpeptidase ErfK/SrfK
VFLGHVRTVLANRENHASRTAVTVGMIGVVAAAVSAGLLLSSGGGPSAGRAARAVARPPVTAAARQAGQLRRDTARHGSARPGSTGPGSTLLATVLRTTPRYASPGRLAAGTVPASWYSRPSVLPVIATRPGWVQVRLAQRPDESTAWLPASDVTLGRTPYRIVVDNATTELALYDEGRLVFSAPAGVGTPDDPTPAGKYFVAFDEQPPQPNPGYGPFIVVTSAHSPAIGDWEGSGDAIIGIHGPLGEDSEIGTSGARISHGCIRLHDQALERLTGVPAGTPVDVVG